MRDYVIVTDSTSDLPASLEQELEVVVIPMEFTINEDSYHHYPDERELPTAELYRRLREGETAKTTQISPQQYRDTFLPILESGRDVFYLCFSSLLSGSYNSACITAADMAEEYPDAKIRVIDTLAASLGEGMTVYDAVYKKRAGLDIDELEAWVLAERCRFCHRVTVDDLYHLQRGGRITIGAAIVGSVLGMKPMIHMDDTGRLVTTGKLRGRKKALGALVEQMAATCPQPKGQTIFIGHGDCMEDAEYVKSLVEQRFPVKEVIISYIGPVIGSHTGPGVLALFFRGTER